MQRLFKPSALYCGRSPQGVGIPVDIARGFQCYERAAAAGVPQAMFNLARCYQSGSASLPRAGRRGNGSIVRATCNKTRCMSLHVASECAAASCILHRMRCVLYVACCVPCAACCASAALGWMGVGCEADDALATQWFCKVSECAV